MSSQEYFFTMYIKNYPTSILLYYIIQFPISFIHNKIIDINIILYSKLIPIMNHFESFFNICLIFQKFRHLEFPTLIEYYKYFSPFYLLNLLFFFFLFIYYLYYIAKIFIILFILKLQL